jgi:SH3-like domain-containing protein
MNMNSRTGFSRLVLLPVMLGAALLLSGCGILFGGSEAPPTETPAPRPLVPTFTPTAVQAAVAPTATPVPQTQVVTVTVDGAAPAAAPAAALTSTTAVTTTAVVTDGAASSPTATPAVVQLKVETDLVNVRLGPGTNYGLAGTVNQGEVYAIKGRSEDKQWFLICCVNGQEVWVNGELTDEENEELAPVVAAPPAPEPVAVATAAPAAPAAPAPTEAPAAPAPAADACAGIGGDGCKFKLRNGPKFGPGSNELKMQFAFIHSGIDGGQAQGSYFVWIEKDGVKLPVSDSVRSVTGGLNQGTLGRYNYEYKLGLSSLPGNNVAGNYVIWVLDGNGERDSQTFSFSVPDGQGELWIEFDQG